MQKSAIWRSRIVLQVEYWSGVGGFCMAVLRNNIPLLLHYELWRRLSKRNKNDYPAKQSSLLNGWKVNPHVNGILIKDVLFVGFFFPAITILYSLCLLGIRNNLKCFYSETKANLVIAKLKLWQKIKVWLVVSNVIFGSVSSSKKKENWRSQNSFPLLNMLLMPSGESSLRAVNFPLHPVWYSFQMQLAF